MHNPRLVRTTKADCRDNWDDWDNRDNQTRPEVLSKQMLFRNNSFGKHLPPTWNPHPVATLCLLEGLYDLDDPRRNFHRCSYSLQLFALAIWVSSCDSCPDTLRNCSCGWPNTLVRRNSVWQLLIMVWTNRTLWPLCFQMVNYCDLAKSTRIESSGQSWRLKAVNCCGSSNEENTPVSWLFELWEMSPVYCLHSCISLFLIVSYWVYTWGRTKATKEREGDGLRGARPL